MDPIRLDVVFRSTTVASNGTSFADFINSLIEIANLLIPLLIALSLLTFFKGIVAFIGKSGSETEIKKGKNLLVWGLASLFVMVSLYGILAWMSSNAGFSGNPFHEILPLLPTN